MGLLIKRLIEEIKKGNVSYFYTSRTWRRKRKEILDRDNDECQICKENGKVTAGTKEDPLIVHHIKELKDRPDLCLTDSNLLTVCDHCHETVCHPNRLGEYKEKKKVIDIPERWE